jgi:hypothetical protein
MRTTTAYFAGVGTVVAAVALGLGGGLLISNILSPHEPKIEVSRLEQRMSSKPIPVSNAPSEPVPYLAATQAVPSAATAAEAPQPQPPAPTPPTETVAANPPSPSDAVPAQAPQPAPREQAVAVEPENAFAKARDTDVKRVKEKRKAERRQQWTERRRHLQRQDQELREVEEKVREATEPRQAFTVEPARLEMRRIRLFEDE